MRNILTILVVLCSIGVAQNPGISTGGMSNGRMWNSIDEGSKVFYISGVYDSLMLKSLTKSAPPSGDNMPWAIGFMIKDYVNELNKLYRDGSNIRIPVPLAVDYCTVVLKGQTKKDDLETQLISLRKLASSLSSK